jgi:hypothetical protein
MKGFQCTNPLPKKLFLLLDKSPKKTSLQAGQIALKDLLKISQ